MAKIFRRQVIGEPDPGYAPLDKQLPPRRAAAYLRALGRFPEDQKRAFIGPAIHHMEIFSQMRKDRWRPNGRQERLLRVLARRVNALIIAMQNVERAGVPPYGPRDRDVPNTLVELREAAVWLSDPKPRQGLLLLLEYLAGWYYFCFDTGPTFGTNSPFVKFCNVALPDYGFGVPAIHTIRRMALQHLVEANR